MKADVNALSTPKVRSRLRHGLDRSEAFAARGTFALRWPDAFETRLRGGTEVSIRLIRHADLELERRFVAGLSVRTRFKAWREPGDATVTRI